VKKSRYLFRFRRISDPPELEEIEAGPFTPHEAEVFGQTESGKRAMLSGRVWVCDYSEIVEGDEAESPPWRHRWVVLLIAVIVAFILWRMKGTH
jgi:hypothetical protein